MSDFMTSRRGLILAAGTIAFAGSALAARGRREEKETEVTANEDLMREHSLIRRVLFVYVEAARRARKDPAAIPLRSLQDAARLFRQFAEDYHERDLEEAHIFPVVRELRSPVSVLPEVLAAQHRRGREITDYVQRIAASGRIPAAEAGRFADTLETFVAMYGPHAAFEDTVLFPAWEAALGEKRYREMGERFEEIEHRAFGRDGFEEALARVAAVEAAFGLGASHLAELTPPAPPAA